MADPWAEFRVSAPAAVARPVDEWSDFRSQTPLAGPTAQVPDDVAKSTGAGVVRGVLGVVALPGNIEALGRAGIDWTAQKIAGKNPGFSTPDAEGRTTVLPTSADFEKHVKPLTGDLHKPKTTAGKYAHTIAEFAPNALFPGGPVMRVANVAVPAIASETAGQATEGTRLEPWARVAGAVAGSMAVPAMARGITPNPISPERARQVAVLEAEGVPLTAGQRTGSERLRYRESTSQHVPFGGHRANDVEQAQREAFTRAVTARTGQPVARASDEAVDQAFTRLGAEFDRLAQQNPLRADQAMVADLTQAVQNYHRLVPPSNRVAAVDDYVRDIANGLQANAGQMPGDIYQAIRSRIDRDARGMRNDPQLQQALFGIRNAIDGAVERSMVAAGRDPQPWRTVRDQYRNLLAVERAATGAGSAAAEGLISPSQLRGAMVNQNRRSYARGERELDRLARAGEAIMRPLPQSGTAPRLLSVSSNLPVMMGNAALARATMSRPVQAWLGNQLLPPARQPDRLPIWAMTPEMAADLSEPPRDRIIRSMSQR